ncbi:MAG: diadenylate cyclase CdaA [Acidobacteriota bacterium]|nr:diadenylate cyclase CdaA [Acidobacteriota bacterium]MDH3784828.1 diadenylate cyclase CdaA [Acidobacteriota bacterium]
MIERLNMALQPQGFSLWAFVDILLLAVIIYQLLLLVRGTRSFHMLVALVVLLLAYLVTSPELIPLAALHTVLGNVLLFIPIAVIVLFQGQIRQALANLGKNPLSALLPLRFDSNVIQEISLAAASLGSQRLGALIVIERHMGLKTFQETGIQLDAVVSYDLLMNIFTRRSPLHDGAVIIEKTRIKAASCYLPVTTNPQLSRTYGTRHRAAFGITEESDALAIVVSEERGVVSLLADGRMIEGLDARSLESELRGRLGAGGSGEESLRYA